MQLQILKIKRLKSKNFITKWTESIIIDYIF